MPLEKNIVLNASRHEVWDKVATGPGLSSWFVPHELEAREGGTGRADFGGTALAEGVIEVYDQGNRVVYRGKSADDAGATEPTLEFRLADDGGNQTSLTLRQEGFPEADQAVYEAGWDVYLHTLQASFEHFGGEHAATTASFVDSSLGEKAAFEKVRQALGAEGDVSEGQQVQLQAVAETGGVVELRKSEAPLDAITIRTDDGFVRAIAASYTASGDDEGCAVSVTRFKYARGEGLAAAVGRDEVDAAGLQLWLEEALG
jgi:uncharacterized protein YndB with AHSA1/START domain